MQTDDLASAARLAYSPKRTNSCNPTLIFGWDLLLTPCHPHPPAIVRIIRSTGQAVTQTPPCHLTGKPRSKHASPPVHARGRSPRLPFAQSTTISSVHKVHKPHAVAVRVRTRCSDMPPPRLPRGTIGGIGMLNCATKPIHKLTFCTRLPQSTAAARVAMFRLGTGGG